MANTKLDMGKAWTQATALMGANRDLVGVLAGLFLFIPMFVLMLVLTGSDLDLGAAGSEPNPDLIAAQINAILLANWWAVLLAIFGQLCGGIAILALLGDQSRPTVGEILRLVPRRIVPVVGAQLLIVLMTQLPSLLMRYLPEAAGALGSALLAPVTIYLTIKFYLASAVIVLGNQPNPIAALRESWRLTRSNSFRLLGFFLLLLVPAMVIGLILMLIVGLVLALLGDRGALIGNVAFAAVLVTVFYAVSSALAAAIYRQLSGAAPERLAETFE